MGTRKVKPDFFHRKAYMEYWRARNAIPMIGIIYALAELFAEMEKET